MRPPPSTPATDLTTGDRSVGAGSSVPREGRWYAGAVLLGGALMVVTAIVQPYNQNEWVQIEPYGSSDLHEIVSGTRQPPLDPLLGALVQHLLGVGQLRQRLEPVAFGIGCLALMALLLRRMRLGSIGVLAVYVLATAPVFIRYSAYIRPYALPTFLMLVVCYVGSRWLEDGRRLWLVLAAVAGLLLPLARVPEPTVFLATSALVLVVLGERGVVPRARARTLGVTLLVALVTVGVFSFLALASSADSVFDPDPVHALHRTPAGIRDGVTYVLPLFAHWFPWWPVTLALLVLAVVLPTARRDLVRLWFWVPLVLAPLVFLVAYHTVNSFPLDERHYRARFAYFFAPALVLLVAVVGRALAEWGSRHRVGARLGPAAVAVLLLSQVPQTISVVTRPDVADLGEAADVLRAEVPSNALVLYDSPAPNGDWRQPFFGRSRYLVGAPRVVDVSDLASGVSGPGTPGPVYLLLLDSACASSVVCDLPAVRWSGQVEGYRVVRRFSRFTLYAPAEAEHGRSGAARALAALASAYGDRANEADVFARAHVLEKEGRHAAAARVVARRCDRAPSPAGRYACRRRAADAKLPVTH
jgi:hypothetical protein